MQYFGHNDDYNAEELPPSLIDAKNIDKSDISAVAAKKQFEQQTGIDLKDDDDSVKIPYKYRLYARYRHPNENLATSIFMFPYRSLVDPFRSKTYYQNLYLNRMNADFKNEYEKTGSHAHGHSLSLKEEVDNYNKQIGPRKWKDKSFGEKAITVAKPIANAVSLYQPAVAAAKIAFDVVEAVSDKRLDSKFNDYAIGILNPKDIKIRDIRDKTDDIARRKRNVANANPNGYFSQQETKRIKAAEDDLKRMKTQYLTGALVKAAKVIDKIDSATSGGTFSGGGGGGGGSSRWAKRFPSFYKRKRYNRYITYKTGKTKHRKYKSKRYYRKIWSRYGRKWTKRGKEYW